MRKTTDLAAVKQMATAMLLTDIVETKLSPMVVQHPFTNTGITGVSRNGAIQMLDLMSNAEDLALWREGLKAQIKTAETPYRIFMMLNRSYALTFLKFTEPYLSIEDFSSILADIWVMAECTNGDVNVNKRKLAAMFRRADPSVLMDEAERSQLAALDDPVTVYRGVTSHNARNIRALSWTLDYDTAAWFAHRFGEEGTVYEAQISKEHIFALFNGRNESEIVLDPKHLLDIAPAQEPEQVPGMTMQ